MAAGIGPISHLLAAVAVLLAVTTVAVGFLLPTMPPPASVSIFRLPRGPLLALGLLALCALLAEGAISDWAAVYLRDDLRAGAAAAGLGFAAFSLAMAAGRFCGDRLVWRYGGSAVLARGAGVAAAVFAAALVLDNPMAALVGFAAVGLGLANAVPIVFSVAGKVRGTSPELALAAVSTAGYCGFLSGPPLIGLVAEHLGLGSGLGIVAIALAIVALGGTVAATRR
jgi:fucose permease